MDISYNFGDYYNYPMEVIMKTIAIVTGASSGIGKQFVKLLLKEQEIDEIWAIARDQQKLQNLRKKAGHKIITYSLDLSRAASIAEFEHILKEKTPNIKYLVNSAGYAKFCTYKDLSIQETVNMIDLNCSGVVSMSLASIPYMGRGSHIINLASQAAFQPLPYQNVYSSTKAFVRNYSRALNVELKGTGISVTAVCPGWVRTALYDRAMIGAKKATNKFVGMVSPDKVAAKALRDAKSNKDISVYGIHTKLLHVAAKILPQRMVMKIWLMQQNL